MSLEEQQRWDRRYTDGLYTPRSQPSAFLVEWTPRIPVGRALDLACGTGRNALHLAEAGFDVEGIDGSAVAIDLAREAARTRGLDVRWRVADLDAADIGSGWDLITVFRYRNTSLWPRLGDALAPDGWLVVDHHLLTDVEVAAPSDDFRVRPQEFLDAFSDLRIVHYSEGVEPSDDGTQRYCVARLVACRGNPGF